MQKFGRPFFSDQTCSGQWRPIDIRLHPTVRDIFSNVRYAALSYVWGVGPHTHCTLQGNIERHRARIPWAGLPQTIKDAVECTRRLNIQYVWIDSLCIKQDEDEDKVRELPKMPDIYKRAYVTISAAGASSSQEGFLATRSDPLQETTRIFRKFALPKNPAALREMVDEYQREPTSMFPGLAEPNPMHDTTYEIDRHDYWRRFGHSEDYWAEKGSAMWLIADEPGTKERRPLDIPDLDSEPISQRAWCLQESLLSPRQLIYTSRQILWKCRECVAADGGRTGNERVRPEKLVDGGSSHTVEDDGEWLGLVDSWERIVSEYSKRKLTNRTDTLRAISAIALEMERRTGRQYFIGLWKDALIHGLSWYQPPVASGSGQAINWTTRQTCPTFAWIKVDGPVVFYREDDSDVVIHDSEVHREQVVKHGEMSELEVIASIELTGPIITSSDTAFLIEFGVVTEPDDLQRMENAIWPDGGSTNKSINYYHHNGQAVKSFPETLTFLELSHGSGHSGLRGVQQSRGLVLMLRPGSSRTYVRVGYFVVSIERDYLSMGISQRMMFTRPGHVSTEPTEFGRQWITSLRRSRIFLA